VIYFFLVPLFPLLKRRVVGSLRKRGGDQNDILDIIERLCRLRAMVLADCTKDLGTTGQMCCHAAEDGRESLHGHVSLFLAAYPRSLLRVTGIWFVA
jgi:hypothetical protein